MNDDVRIHEYVTMCSQLEKIIKEVSELGFDMSYFEREFKNITRKIEGDKNQNNCQGAFQTLTITDYVTSITELRSLENEIRKFEPYFLAVKYSRFVIENMNPFDDEEKIQNYVNLMIAALKIIRKLSGYKTIDDALPIKRIYEIAYETIKVEIIKTGKSQIIENSSSIEKTIFDDYIRADLKKLNLKEPKYAAIREQIFNIEKQGLGTSYCDLELIRLIIANTKNEYKDKIVSEIEHIAEEMMSNDRTITDGAKKLQTYLDDKKDYHHASARTRKNVRKDIISLVLAWSIAMGGAYGSIKLDQRIATKKIYKMNKKVYTDTLDYPQITEEEVAKDGARDIRQLIYYSAWEEGEEGAYREVKIYDFSSITLDDVYDYFRHDLNEDLLDSSEVITENYELDKDKYQQEFKELIEITYEDTGEKIIDKNEFYEGLPISALMYFVLEFVILGLWSGEADRFILSPRELIYDLKKLKELKEEHGINNREFKRKLKEIMDKVNTNKELKKKFENVFEENKYLLANPDELQRKVAELEKSRKQEVKTLKKKRIFG